MENFFTQTLTILTTSPGNLIFHLAVAFSLVIALQGVVFHLKAPLSLHPRRLFLGLGVPFLFQIALFIFSALVWQGLADSRSYLPLFDRTIFVLTMLWLVWIWVFPAPQRAADIGLAALNVVLIVAYLATAGSWAAQSASYQFNASAFDLTWILLAATMLLAGITALFITRPGQWGVGVSFFAVNLLAIFIHIFVPENGDLSGILRLAQICTFPLLPVLAQRLQGTADSEITRPKETPPIITRPENGFQKKNALQDPHFLTSWLKLAGETNTEKIGVHLAHAIAQSMLADLCFILVPSEDPAKITIQSGYDLIREEELSKFSLQSAMAPNLAAAIQYKKPLRSSANNPIPDIRTLAEAHGLTEGGGLMFIPLVTENILQNGLVLLSPYSNHVWSEDEQNILLVIKDQIIDILKRQTQPGAISEDTSQLSQMVEAAKNQLEQLRSENMDLKQQLIAVQSSTGKPESQSDLETLLKFQQESQELNEKLQLENEQLKSIATKETAASDEMGCEQVEAELRLTLEEFAHLQNQLANANIKILEMEKQGGSPLIASSEDREVIASIVQELRQPMSSITGYTDLLLGESVGILGALQRKFMERIKASNERMRGLIDDLLQITALQNNQLEILPQPVDLNVVIDQAVSDTGAQMREKNIILKVDLPDELPQLYADRDALQQILIHLLRNAATVSPVEGSISLRVHNELEKDDTFILFQITDSGGGINPDDMPRVFSRRYRADNSLIQGVGDSGVGLSIAKALVDAHGGRIWVECVAGKSSTFSVLLPLNPTPSIPPSPES
jgi:signal transduction histidine kinase